MVLCFLFDRISESCVFRMTKEERALRAQENRDLTRGPIFKKIILFALPIMAGNLFQQFYNVVDSWVVGNFAANGTACLAAVNASFSIMLFFNSIYMGISLGANIVLSQYKGAKDHERLQTGMTTTFTLSLWCGLIITAIGLLTTRWILEVLGTPEEILDDAALYLRIIFIGTCGNVIYNGMTGMLRGLGDAKYPMYALIFAAILNIILDMLFVIVFHWDVAGVAWATIIAHLVSGLLLVWKQHSGIYGAKIDFRHLRMDRNILKLILKLGLPAAVQNAAFSVGNMINQSFSNRFGVSYIAAHAIIMKADGFAILPMIGMQMATTTYVGQNIGAGDVERTNKGIGAACVIGTVFAILVGVLLLLFGKDLMAIFGVHDEALQMGITGLNFIAYFYVFTALQNVLGGALRGAGASVASAIATVSATLLRIPLGYFLAIRPLNADCRAAVEAGLYATAELAEKAGVGMEHYFGL
ncbi:MAG: MATE family efflux transporter, partial [Ruminococcaceae bacterium]|nr:MATE family efflux transporter [Oscillospiraceae bacterium]